MKKKILITTGGSGGHAIPATILFDHLKKNFEVFLETDKRGASFIDSKKYKYKVFSSVKLDSFFTIPINLFKIIILFVNSIIYLKKNNFNIIISTGGYMSIPTCFAAKILGLDIFLLEPNMAIGRSNRFFLNFTKKIFCYSANLKYFPKKYEKKIIVIPSLLRKEIYEIKSNKEKEYKKFKILIIGGSQGAMIFEKKIIPLIIQLSKKINISVYHQIKFDEKKYKEISETYQKNNINFELFNFKHNILKYISESDLVITRAGASTLAELVYLNIPFVAVPFPQSKDNHQLENANYYKNKNCCWVFEEKNFFKENSNIFLLNLVINTNEIKGKKENMRKISYQNTWNNINEILVKTLYEN